MPPNVHKTKTEEKHEDDEAIVLCPNNFTKYDPTVPNGDSDYTTMMIPEERQFLLQKSSFAAHKVDHEVAEILYDLFSQSHHESHIHPRTNPQLPPEKRGLRHRNYYVGKLNKGRRWWKTSRLLVRLSGGYVYCEDPLNWSLMALWNVTISKEAKQAYKQMKHIGQGGTIKPFLVQVHPITRSIRIILAVARAWEAKVDNRLLEIGVAEACAFMGNRCFRFWSRQLVDNLTKHVSLPLSGAFLATHLGESSRSVIMAMGFLRAVLPFAMSFQGSRFGRQMTLSTFRSANYRWQPIQGIMHFHEKAGNYADTELDPELLALARNIAESIGHGKDPQETRRNLRTIGFKLVGSGSGGYAVYRSKYDDKIIHLHVTPYGPSIDDEMPRYILLERRRCLFYSKIGDDGSANILDAALPREAMIQGFTYSGAYFQGQEWAALKNRHDKELKNWNNACRVMRSKRLPAHKRNPMESKMTQPPTTLVELKAFLRLGDNPKKQAKEDRKWQEIQVQVKKMAKLVAKYQKEGRAPKRVILYLEGLDCAGKSSTGVLICNALEQCGFSVTQARHNRPPTEEQRNYPWCHRIRFEYPDDMYPGEKCPEYASVVWDRGPAGDFVYGPFAKLPLEEKMKKYREFRAYDCQCREDGVLFLKCFFVSDKDTIAATLGKRLAHKEILRDLRTWLDDNSYEHFREGLEEIALHIDPTDFVAYNNYENNLAYFSEFARNTDRIGHIGDGHEEKFAGYNNPWFVVNTSDRHLARLAIMQAFDGQLHRFAASCYGSRPSSILGRLVPYFDKKTGDDFHDGIEENYYVPNGIVEQKERGISLWTVLQGLCLLMILYGYIYQTWHVTWDDII